MSRLIVDLIFIVIYIYIARLWYRQNKIKEEEIKVLNKTFDKLEELEKEIKVEKEVNR